MLTKLAMLALLPIFAAVAFAVAYFVFYRGGYEPPPVQTVPLEQIGESPLSPRVSADPAPGLLRQGLLVVDAQHANTFSEGELVNFASRVADRGFEVEFVGNFAPLGDPSEAPFRLKQLADKLRRADSLAVILPRMPFSEAEASLVEGFVRKGGKLLLVSDPSRPQSINSLAKRFGVDFQTDYLYNTIENDAHFRRIFVRDFQPDQLTSGLQSITLDYASSVQSTGDGLAFTGSGTKSSVLDTVRPLSPIVWGNTRNVLAIADFTFMVPNNDSMLDNGRLVSNIADYLTDVDREFHLADYPYFYDNGDSEGVDILMGQPELLQTAMTLKNGLAGQRVESGIVPAEDLSRDTAFLGLYDDAPLVEQYLERAGVGVGDTLGTPFAVDLDPTGMAVTVLDRSQGRDFLVVLADTPQTLSAAVDRLLSGEFRNDIVSDNVAVRKFEGMGG